MKISDAGVELIKEFEGFSSRPYRDAVGVWTIGYGHIEGVGPSSPHLTLAEGKALLARDLDRKYAPYVNVLVNAGVKLTQHQFDALVSLVYNCGPGAIVASSTVGRALRAGRMHAAADGFLLWNKAGGSVLAGLTRRRKAERALFLSAARPKDALAGYASDEKRWIREYDQLRREDRDLERRKVLRRYMRAQRKRIWHAAKRDGWAKAWRRERYRSLLARSS
ncbi:lysozyme [Patulibacter minatonensis]|uniref:lysozyme n=1 Tax=Patulibacter minatonensis TaxID=298163 RepID=UPI0004B90056|nr:lysozyme [Patulibacter minatonensis]